MVFKKKGGSGRQASGGKNGGADADLPASGKTRKRSAAVTPAPTPVDAVAAPVAVADAVTSSKPKKRKRSGEGGSLAAAPGPAAQAAKATKAGRDGTVDEAAVALPAGSADAQALTREAVAVVYKGISQPEMQGGMKAFIPMDWTKKFKPVLGPYKKFLLAHPDKFKVIEHDLCNFTVKRADEAGDGAATTATGAGTASKGSWQKLAMKAWLAYCFATPKPSRRFADFKAAIPTGMDVQAVLKEEEAAVTSKGKTAAVKKKAKGKVLGRMVSADGATERDVKAAKKSDAMAADNPKPAGPPDAGKRKKKKPKTVRTSATKE